MANDTGPGPGVDAQGRPVIDPTKNVLDLVTREIKRLDDLREVESKNIREMLDLRAEFAREFRMAESQRLDAIRAVDVGAVNRAAEVSATQAATLAAQVATSAETLRTQVAAAATAAATALAAALEPIQKDIQDLRKAQYEIAGAKANVTDTRLNLGAVLGGLSVLLVLVFGTLSLVIR